MTTLERIDNIEVTRTGSRDIDSVNVEIFVLDKQIGYGHINHRTNFAHVTLEAYINELLPELEHELVEAIESRTIELK